MTEPKPTVKLSLPWRRALLSPAVLLFASGVRLLIISNYDPVTATSIASSGGTVGTLLGTIVPLIPQYLPLLILVLLALRRPVLLCLAVAGTILVSPIYATVPEVSHEIGQRFLHADWGKAGWPLIFGGIATLALAIDYKDSIAGWFFTEPPLQPILPTEEDEEDEDNAITPDDMLIWNLMVAGVAVTVAASVTLAGAGAFMFITTLYRVPHSGPVIAETMRKPWMPAEEMRLKSGVIDVGYTIAIKDGWNIFLSEKSRTIEYIRADDVVSRKPCRVQTSPETHSTPLLRLITVHRNPTPQCAGFPLGNGLPEKFPPIYGGFPTMPSE